MNADLSKKSAALRASEFINSGMNIGLGTGSTVFYLLEKLREMVAQGLQINAVSSSKATEKICKDFNIPLYPMNEMGRLHITIAEKEKYIDKGGRINEYTNYYRNWTYRIYHSSRYFSSSKRKEEIKAVLKLQRRCFR